MRDVLKKLSPAIAIDRIGPAPMPGFREVVAGGQVVYVSDDGKYLFQGGLLDIDSAQGHVRSGAWPSCRKEVLKTMPVSDRIVFAPAGTPKHTVIVLTDIECGYCRKLHSEIAEYQQARASRSNTWPSRAWASAARTTRRWSRSGARMIARKALTDAKNDRSIDMKSCPNPVTMQYAAGQPHGPGRHPDAADHRRRVLGGYLPPDALLQRLEKIDSRTQARQRQLTGCRKG